MIKYKVGDKVIVTDLKKQYSFDLNRIGKILDIENVRDNILYLVQMEYSKNNYTLKDCSFIPLTPKSLKVIRVLYGK